VCGFSHFRADADHELTAHYGYSTPVAVLPAVRSVVLNFNGDDFVDMIFDLKVWMFIGMQRLQVCLIPGPVCR